MRLIDLAGHRYGRLEVVARGGREGSPRHRLRWVCRCDCGETLEVRGENLRSGNTTSCGCVQRERTALANLTHGATVGYAKSRLYYIWCSMIQRCTNVSAQGYKYYGGRGITVCSEWRDFEGFSAWALPNGYVAPLTIERVDVNGNYEPSNCTWIPMAEQSKNRRCCLKKEAVDQ